MTIAHRPGELKRTKNYIQIYPVSEGYLRKIPVSRRVKCPSPLGIFASPLNRYFSQITLTNMIYLYKMDFGTVPTVWYFVDFHIKWILELFRQCGILLTFIFNSTLYQNAVF